MTTRERRRRVQYRLAESGFYNGKIDGLWGPKSRAASRRFRRAFAGGKDGMRLLPRNTGDFDDRLEKAALQLPYLSPNFRADEFKSNGNGDCNIRREVILGLEKYRRVLGGPIFVVSGYRDPAWNSHVGGASVSRHTYAKPVPSGDACDINGRHTVAELRELGVFSGFGIKASTGKVVHVDCRATQGQPGAVWYYY